MKDSVPDRAGQRRPKHEIAREALEGILQYTNAWTKKHPDRVLELGLYRFSSGAAEVLPIGPFQLAKAQAALAEIPGPGGGTAIGTALEEGFKALYRTGCTRKFVVCLSDGENTSGNPPEYIARMLHEQTKGDVEIHFVAFDIASAKFDFLKSVNGQVVEAADGAQLQARLTDIYEKRILAEAPPAEK
jgi:Mg-chelatase subunit ChlD